jgi:hypothetical protein
VGRREAKATRGGEGRGKGGGADGKGRGKWIEREEKEMKNERGRQIREVKKDIGITDIYFFMFYEKLFY